MASKNAELAASNCKSIILCYNVWNFPFFVWPFIKSLVKDKPILSLSNNNGKYPGNVGMLATYGALRQTGIKTHRIIGEADDPETQKKVLAWIRHLKLLLTLKMKCMVCMADIQWVWKQVISI